MRNEKEKKKKKEKKFLPQPGLEPPTLRVEAKRSID